MSFEATAQTWKHHRAANRSQLLVLLTLADYAQDDGTDIFPKTKTLQQKALYDSDRGVQHVLQQLIQSGQIVCHKQKGPSGTNRVDLVYGDGSNWDVIVQRCQALRHTLAGCPYARNCRHPEKG